MKLDIIGKQGNGASIIIFRFHHGPILFPQQRQVSQYFAGIGDQRKSLPEAFLGPLGIPRFHKAITIEEQGLSSGTFPYAFIDELLEHRDSYLFSLRC